MVFHAWGNNVVVNVTVGNAELFKGIWEMG